MGLTGWEPPKSNTLPVAALFTGKELSLARRLPEASLATTGLYGAISRKRMGFSCLFITN